MDSEINDRFYNAVRYGHLRAFKLLLVETGLKNPEIQTPKDGLVTALDLAFKYHHYAMTRIISRVLKDPCDINWDRLR